jgi:ribonuclease HIII
MSTVNTITTKRFVIRRSLIGTNTVISFTNNKNELMTYNHDKVYEQLKDKFEAMPCFAKYNSYTNTNNLPVFVRNLKELV